MGYRDPQQELQPSLGKIVQGIVELDAAISQRVIASDEWTPEHIEELYEFRVELAKLKNRFEKLRKSTW